MILTDRLKNQSYRLLHVNQKIDPKIETFLLLWRATHSLQSMITLGEKAMAFYWLEKN